MGARPRALRSSGARNEAPQSMQIASVGWAAARQLWQTWKRWEMPGVSSARAQNWRVVGPEMTDSRVILPFLMRTNRVA